MAVRSRSTADRTRRAAPRRAASGTRTPAASRKSNSAGKGAQGKAGTGRAPVRTRRSATSKGAQAPRLQAGPVRCDERTDDYKVLVFGASCALDNAGALRDALLEELSEGTPLVLDGSEIERIDAAGLQLLVGLSIECMERGIAFAWRARSEPLKGAIALTGVAALLESPMPVNMPARP